MAPVTVASHESLADLNVILRERGVNEVPLNRFRMNIEVVGCSRPFEEDDWFLRGVARILDKGGKDNVIARKAHKIFVTRSHTY